MSWRRPDTLNVSLALSSSEYVRFNAGLLQNVDWSGKSLDKTPDVTTSLSYAHGWDLPNGGRLTAQAATRHSSGYLVSNFVQAVQIEQDAFTRTDANVTYVSPGGKLKVTAFVKNIEDELQILGAPGTYAPANVNLGSAAASEPRFMGCGWASTSKAQLALAGGGPIAAGPYPIAPFPE